jgi:hypothetical protein
MWVNVHQFNGGSVGRVIFSLLKLYGSNIIPALTDCITRFHFVITIMGSDDHNSGRMIIAPVGGVNYLFYALGDMGTGNYNNKRG